MWTRSHVNTWAAYLYSPLLFHHCALTVLSYFLSPGVSCSFSLGSSLPLFPKWADVLSVHHRLPYTWQIKMTSVYHLLTFVGQKSRHIMPGPTAQVLMDLKSSVSGLHSHQRSGVFFQAHSDGYQSSAPCWLCTQGVTLSSKRPLSCPCHMGNSIFKVSNGELLTQQICLLLQISPTLIFFSKKELVPSKGSCDEVKLHEDNLMFSVNCAMWHNLIMEAISHPIHRFLPLHDRGDYTRMGLFGDHLKILLITIRLAPLPFHFTTRAPLHFRSITLDVTNNNSSFFYGIISKVCALPFYEASQLAQWYSSILAWKILWTAEPGRLLSMR